MLKRVLSVENVSKVYKSGSITVKALEHISFSLEKGEFAAIVGPSGSGKSTLMNVLGTIDKPTGGEIYIDGVAVSKMSGNELADFRNKKLGFVFQSFNLIKGLDAEKNVELPLMVTNLSSAERKKRADELLVGLGLGHGLKNKPYQLSGGEQQRVAVARALVNKPAMLLADEPTGNLASQQSNEVIKILRRISEEDGVTVVMVTHNMDLTKHCDRILHIKDGKLEQNRVM
ncbi:MAG: ABC transporter ATP-binding protein [Candidatus Marsarchaeota archaeon]|nr:ABC transporter ATP-binding protein [Candidatus Marsarchaeota archaeon]MCL5114946.1 ABC transporter ATP-binding protein [Candidatus Marsarchaeota archaeon]